jgi:hypothetical protein
MTKGLPVREAEAQAASFNVQIQELGRPVELHFRLAPFSATR